MKKVIASLKKNSSKPKQKNRKYTVEFLLRLPYVIELKPLSKQDGGGYSATIPLLIACQSDGSTPDEAIKNLREAQKAWFVSALKHGDTIPVP